MRSSMVVAATLLAALLGERAAAEQRADGRASLGARALTDRVLALTRQVDGLEASNAALGEIVLNAAGSNQVLRGNGDVTLDGADVRVQASSRIVLSAPVLVTHRRSDGANRETSGEDVRGALLERVLQRILLRRVVVIG